MARESTGNSFSVSLRERYWNRPLLWYDPVEQRDKTETRWEYFNICTAKMRTHFYVGQLLPNACLQPLKHLTHKSVSTSELSLTIPHQLT